MKRYGEPYITFYKYMKNFFTIQHKNLVNNRTVLKLKKKKTNYLIFSPSRINFTFQIKKHLYHLDPLASQTTRPSHNSIMNTIHNPLPPLTRASQ